MNTKIFFKLVMGSLLLAIILISSGFNAEHYNKPINGDVVYKKNCSVCHRKNGKGIPNTFPPLAKSDYLKTHTKEEIITIVLKGQKGKLKVNGKTYNNVMLPLKQLSDEEIAAVLTYVSNNFGNEGEAYIVDEVKNVREGLKK